MTACHRPSSNPRYPRRPPRGAKRSSTILVERGLGCAVELDADARAPRPDERQVAAVVREERTTDLGESAVASAAGEQERRAAQDGRVREPRAVRAENERVLHDRVGRRPDRAVVNDVPSPGIERLVRQVRTAGAERDLTDTLPGAAAPAVEHELPAAGGLSRICEVRAVLADLEVLHADRLEGRLAPTVPLHELAQAPLHHAHQVAPIRAPLVVDDDRPAGARRKREEERQRRRRRRCLRAPGLRSSHSRSCRLFITSPLIITTTPATNVTPEMMPSVIGPACGSLPIELR